MIRKLLKGWFGSKKPVHPPYKEKKIKFDVLEDATGRVLFTDKTFSEATCLQNILKQKSRIVAHERNAHDNNN